MTRRLLHSRRPVFVALASLLAIACVVSTTTRSERVEKSALAATTVRSPIKAHMMDGSVVLFPDGAAIGSAMVTGAGRRLDVARRAPVITNSVPLDSVVGFEVYERRTNPIRTLVYSTATTAASLFGIALVGVALFGSCPTIYSDSAGVETLQAETFSYSIAPLLAKRDVDRMTVTPDANGVIRLTVKNEALETHHLDHMEVIEVRHAAGELALPSPRGGALAVSDRAPDASVTDRSGRNVTRIVARTDDAVFSTDNGFLDAAIAGGPTDDQLTIAISRQAGVDSVALVLRARSSLLTTSVLYEHLMGRQGALALDWMADLSKITTLARLAGWYGSNFGMRVEVQDGNQWRNVIRLMDFGPTAWRDVGVAIPATRSADDSIRVRLTFAADAFRIDELSLARRLRRAEQRVIPLARTVDAEGKQRTDMRQMLAKADDHDVETHPGQKFTIEFDAGKSSAQRTFFFAGQGYYVEWLRPSWMKEGAEREPFAGNNASMRDLLKSWRGGRDSLETLFFSRRVPIA